MVKRMIQACFFSVAVLVSSSTIPLVGEKTHANNQYEKDFCTYYDYEGCEEYWRNMENRIDKIVESMKKGYEKTPNAIVLKRLTSLTKKIKAHQYGYEKTSWHVLLQYLYDSFNKVIEETIYKQNTLTVPKKYIESMKNHYTEQTELKDQLRRTVITQLIDSGYDGFIELPYRDNTLQGRIESSNESKDYNIAEIITEDDPLDTLIDKFLMQNSQEVTSDLSVFPEQKEQRKGNIHLFKKNNDLIYYGYVISSHRTRDNYDKQYRRNNIAKAFDYIGHVRVINPGVTVSFLEDSKFDPTSQVNYEHGLVIFLDEEVEDYGGGLCGASTALYQGVVTNSSIKTPRRRNHSKWYGNLYSATIDGKNISTPGMDSTIYSPYLDFTFTNTANHPIVLVSNYDGGYGEKEEVFTIGKASDRGYISYQNKYNQQATLKTKTGEKKVTGACYNRDINGQQRTSCYKEIK